MLVPVDTDKVEEAAVGFGLNVPVVPVGSPLTLKVTGALKPPTGVRFTV